MIARNLLRLCGLYREIDEIEAGEDGSKHASESLTRAALLQVLQGAVALGSNLT